MKQFQNWLLSISSQWNFQIWAILINCQLHWICKSQTVYQMWMWICRFYQFIFGSAGDFGNARTSQASFKVFIDNYWRRNNQMKTSPSWMGEKSVSLDETLTLFTLIKAARISRFCQSVVSSFTSLISVKSRLWEKSEFASALKQWPPINGRARHLFGYAPNKQLALFWRNWLAGPGGVHIRPLLPPRHSEGPPKKGKVHTEVEGWPHLSGLKTLRFFHTVANFQAVFFFFFYSGGKSGWSKDETIDLIMHACFPIHCSGGKGREAKGVWWEGSGVRKRGGNDIPLLYSSHTNTHTHTRSSLGARLYRLMRWHSASGD